MRRLAATRREGYEDQEWLLYMSRLRANMLGIDMDGWTPLAPGSYIVGHRKPLAGNTEELQIREMAWRW